MKAKSNGHQWRPMMGSEDQVCGRCGARRTRCRNNRRRYGERTGYHWEHWRSGRLFRAAGPCVAVAP